MDFSLSDEQRAWQMTARKFAEEEIRPISLERDAIADPRETFDWEIIKKGSKLGFRTMAVPKEWGGHGTDFVTQALVMAELAKADSAISKTFSQYWKWSHLIAASCTDEQKERFLKPFLADDTFLLGKGITEPSAGSDNRLPPADDSKAGLKLKAERHGDEWILNGEKCFIANASVGKLFFIDARTNPERRRCKRGHHHVPGAARHARLPHRQGVQQERLALLPERRDDLRERARAARQRGGRGERRRHEERQPRRRRHHRRRPVRRPRARRQRARRVRRRLRAGDGARAQRASRAARPLFEQQLDPAQAQPDAHADRGAALVRDAGRLGARPQAALRQSPAWR